MRHVTHFTRFATALFMAAALSAAAQSIVICTSCSWELAGNARFCSNCGTGRAQEPRQAAPANDANADATNRSDGVQPAGTPAVSAPPASPAAAAILQDIAWAREFRTGGNNAAAYAALANARALISLAPADAVSEDDRRFVFDGTEALRKDLRLSSPATCPACKGSGIMEIPTEVRGLAGTAPMAIPKQKETCKFCVGKGRIFRYQPAAIRSLMTAGEREYARVAQIAGYKLFPRSIVYMPDKFASELTRDQTNLLTKTTSAVCVSCAGFGREACASCEGTGIVKCPDKDCVNGIVRETPAPAANTPNARAGNVRSQPITPPSIIKRCDVCKGSAFIVCPPCGGSATAPCRRCAR